MSGKKSIHLSLLFNLLAVTTISSILVGGLWALSEYERFNKDAQRLRDDYVLARKRQMQEVVDNVVAYVEFKQRQSEQRTRSLLRERVYEAHQLATHLYERCRASHSDEEVRQLILDVLGSVRFNKGRGYYFVGGLDGVVHLLDNRPGLDVEQQLGLQDSQGAYVVRDMLDIIQKDGEGYCSYTWTKPGSPGGDYRKVAFVKPFESLGWFIGASAYLEDVEKDLKKEALDWIRNVQVGKDGYVFVGTWEGGKPIVSSRRKKYD